MLGLGSSAGRKKAAVSVLLSGVGGMVLYWFSFECSYEPSERRVANAGSSAQSALWVLGKKAFYRETFGNEVFLSDVVGITDGAVSVWSFAKALLELAGRGTDNLEIEIPRDVRIGDVLFRKGQKIDTGLDVARGAFLPLGVKLKKSGGRILVGVTCAICHSTVDPVRHQVIHGAPNSDLNAGMLLAFASNSAAFLAHADRSDFQFSERFARSKISLGPDRPSIELPQISALERAVDSRFLLWPPGTFDSVIDFRAAPTKIPSVFTQGNHPYGWSGNFSAGPFKGLSAQTSHFHGLNSDTTVYVNSAGFLLGISPETYLGTVLQNSASERFRFVGGETPQKFLSRVGSGSVVPALTQVLAMPSYPQPSALSPLGLWAGAWGQSAGRTVKALAVWQNSLRPPFLEVSSNAHGRRVFESARCVRCHSGAYLTDNRTWSVEELGTQPIRARAWRKTQQQFEFRSVPLSFVGLMGSAEVSKVALGWDGQGGYKTPGLTGLLWRAPYLHDGGVAVGANRNEQVGLAATLLAGIPANPSNSLLALIDRKLRAEVVLANLSHPSLRRAGVQGVGHAYWVDPEAGYDAKSQRALIEYLLLLRPPN